MIALLILRIVLMTLTPVFEPSEARYAAITANMARTGDFVVPRFTHDLVYQPFDGKPPLVFQAGALACMALGTDSRFALQLGVRVFPLLSALLVLAILYRCVRRTDGPEAGRLAAAICATSTAFYVAAGLSMTDMSLACCVAGALLLYESFLRTRGWADACGVAALLGAGMIVKGPVALAMFGLPVLLDAAVNRRWNGIFTVRWLAVAPIFLAIAVPWFVLVERRNPGSVWYFFYNENLMRFISHEYGDRYGAGREAFRGVSVIWAFTVTLPWSLVPLWRLARLFRANRFAAAWRRLLGSPLLRSFTVLAVLAIVGFWCLTSRVLLYYLFPVVPLFAAALARHGDCARLRKLVPKCAWLTALITAATLVSGTFISENMRGAATEFNPGRENYAHEFYHGTRPAEELKRHRDMRDAWLRRFMKQQEELKHGRKGLPQL